MSARTRKSLTLLWTALFLCSLLMQYASLASPTPVLAAHNEDIFELDGNALDSGANEPDDDWNSVNHSLDDFFAGAASEAEVNDVTYFTGGGSKDENDIPDWAITDNSVPDKDELLDAYAAVYEDGGDTWVYFGADRFDNDGTAQIGFWFFQDNVGIANGDFTGEHVDGDVLILSEYTNGGSVSLICAYEWDGSNDGNNIADAGDCDPATDGSNLNLVAAGVACDVADGTFDICAVTNEDTEDAPWPFLNKDAETDFGPGQFFEGGINLSDMFGGEPPCFGSFLAETRSSAETDAQLKDFAFGSLDTCVPPEIETQVQQNGQDVSTINKGESVVDVATFSGTNGEVTGSVKFFVCGPANSAPDCENGGTQVGGTVDIVNEEATSAEFTPTATPSFDQADFYCFRAEYTPDEGSQYLAGEHTNQTTECFKVVPADVRIVKSPNDGVVSAGEDIEFVLQWGNIGEGKATGVVVSDDLPAGDGLDWSIAGFTGTGSTCEITGAVGSQVLTCDIGSINGNTPPTQEDIDDNSLNSGSVTLTSGTTSADCGVVDNTGEITSNNDGTNTNGGSYTIECPDVTVEKTPDGDDIDAGDTADFGITVTNDGPGTATDVTLDDPLPAGIDWTLGAVTGDTTGVTCAITGAVNSEVLHCEDTSMADGDSFTVHVSGPTDAADCGTIENTATVGAENEAPAQEGNNTDDGSIDVLCADIDIEKVANPAGPVSAGDDIGFDIVVTNDGDGEARDVTVTDNLPAGFTWSEDSDDCSITANVLTCDFGDMAADATASVHISAPTDADDCGLVTNTASVSTSNDGSDESTDDVTILCPDLEVEKVGNGTIDAGGDAVFTITVTNHGPGEAKDVTLSDQLPAGSWTLGGADAADCDISDTNLLTCDFGDLADDATRTFTVTLATTAADCGDIPNTVTVLASNEPENDQFPNTDNDTIVVQCPDLIVEKTGNGPISAGEVATFTITVTNLGPGAADDATLEDQLPSGDWTLGGADAADCDISDTNLLSCDFGTIDAQDSRTITVSKTSDAGDCDAIPNEVTVDASNEAEEDQGNNTDDASIVVNCPDVTVVKSGNGPISAGEVATFSITVTNLGPGTAFDVTLTDELPDGTWTLGGANADDCSIAGDPAVLSCDFGDLGVDAQRSITLSRETVAADCGEIPNLAVVDASNEADADADNNEDDATIVVDCPEIVITKTADDPSVNAGDQIGFTITVTNTGDGSAFNVQITDVLPAGLTWAISPASPGWSLVAGTLSFGPATLASDAETSVHVIATTTSADCGTIPNVANLTFNGGEGSDDAEVVVNCPDLTVVKSGNGPILNGETATFFITLTNGGPGDAYDVTLTDQLPAGTWTLGGPDAGDCSISATNLLTCDFGDVDAPGEGASNTRTITVSKTAVTADCGTIPNEVTVDGSNEAVEDTDNNSDDASIDVRCPDTEITKTADDDLVEPNQTVTFTLNVEVVEGPVTNAVITDELPVGQTFVLGSAAPSQPTVSPDGRTLTWTFPSLATGDPSITITYDVTIDADASGATQVNTAEICVSEPSVDCDSDDEDVTPEFPEIEIIKTAGDAEDGEVLATVPGPVTYTYVVTNTGPLPLEDVTVTDDAGTPGDTSDDFEADCPQTTLAVDESMTCTFTIPVLVDTTNVAVARGVTAEGNPVEDDDPADVVVLEFGLLIDKSNDAPLETLELPDGSTADLPTADEGETVTYTLDYDLIGDPVTDGVITDVLPVGVTYVAGTASSNAEFTFQSYDDATRTLTWTAPNVTADGTLSYQATVDVGASELAQPLENVATIDSEETEPDDDISDIFVPTIPEAATGTPKITLPPTDAISGSQTPSNPGFSLMLVLLALAAIVLTVGFLTPVPAHMRDRSRR